FGGSSAYEVLTTCACDGCVPLQFCSPNLEAPSFNCNSTTGCRPYPVYRVSISPQRTIIHQMAALDHQLAFPLPNSPTSSVCGHRSSPESRSVSPKSYIVG